MLSEKDGDDNMPAIIERIIKIERAETDAFIKRQNKRLAQLREVERRKNEGKRIHKKPILEELQRAGILDEDGNLSAPYCDKE